VLRLLAANAEQLARFDRGEISADELRSPGP
jgi:hypothetical protein